MNNTFRHQVMLRLRPSFGFFYEVKKVVGELTPTTQDRLQFKVSTKAFFRLMSKLIKYFEKKKINLDFNTVSCASEEPYGFL